MIISDNCMKSFLINYCWLAATQMLAKKKKKVGAAVLAVW